MADTITYPEGSYGIMPNDSFNKYVRFTNQRRATTGIPASPSDQKAFWEGTMESVVKNSATRAAQNLEKQRYASDVALRTRQLDQADEARKTGAISSLAQYPMTYLMYDALGIGREKGTQSSMGKGLDWVGDNIFNPLKRKLTGDSTPGSSLQFSSPIPSQYLGQPMDSASLDVSPGGGYNDYLSNLYNDKAGLLSYGDDMLTSGAASYVDGFYNFPSDISTSDMVNIDNSADMSSGAFDWATDIFDNFPGLD